MGVPEPTNKKKRRRRKKQGPMMNTGGLGFVNDDVVYREDVHEGVLLRTPADRGTVQARPIQAGIAVRPSEYENMGGGGGLPLSPSSFGPGDYPNSGMLQIKGQGSPTSPSSQTSFGPPGGPPGGPRMSASRSSPGGLGPPGPRMSVGAPTYPPKIQIKAGPSPGPRGSAAKYAAPIDDYGSPPTERGYLQ